MNRPGKMSVPNIKLISSIQVEVIGSRPKPHKTTPCIPAFSAGIEYGCFVNNIQNALKSVSERFLYVKTADGFGEVPTPKPGFRQRLSKFVQHISRLSLFIPPLSKEQFLASYEGRKRRVYERAYDSLSIKAFSYKDAFVSWFLKMEKIWFKETKEAVPRGISPRSPRYHVQVGPYIKRMEKKIYEIIDRIFGGYTVFKGLNADQRGQRLRQIWESFNDPVAVPIDAKRFDQHVSYEMLEWEHSIYQLFNNSKYFKYLLSLQLNNKFFANLPTGRFRFQTRGKRCSGDMNTSLGNVLIMCGMMYAYLSERLTKFRIADDGDDCIIFIERKDLSKISDLYESVLDFGFQLEIEKPVDIFEKIEFCQAQPVLIDGLYRMVRKPLQAMAKDSMCIHSLDITGYRRWMRQVALCGRDLSSKVPVMQTFYNKMYDLGEGVALENKTGNLSGMEYLARGMKYKFGLPSDVERYSFWRAFDITPDQQIALEAHIEGLQLNMCFDDSNCGRNSFPCLVHERSATSLQETDQSGENSGSWYRPCVCEDTSADTLLQLKECTGTSEHR